MQISAAGIELVKRSEGFRNTVYRDLAGVSTIGYGHKLLKNESFPDGIDKAQAASILSCDLKSAEDCVDRMVRVPLTQGQFDALVDFVFNVGAGRLASSTLLRVVNEGRYEDAARQLLRWDHAGKLISTALQARREAELKLWNTDDGEKITAA